MNDIFDVIKKYKKKNGWEEKDLVYVKIFSDGSGHFGTDNYGDDNDVLDRFDNTEEMLSLCQIIWERWMEDEERKFQDSTES